MNFGDGGVTDTFNFLQKGEVTIEVLVVLNVAFFEGKDVLVGSSRHSINIDGSQIAVLGRVQEVDVL